MKRNLPRIIIQKKHQFWFFCMNPMTDGLGCKSSISKWVLLIVEENDMSFGHWLKSLTSFDLISLIILFGCSIYLSRVTLEMLIEYYDTKKNYSEFRVHYRITPASLLILGSFYCFLLYNFLSLMFDFLP